MQFRMYQEGKQMAKNSEHLRNLEESNLISPADLIAKN